MNARVTPDSSWRLSAQTVVRGMGRDRRGFDPVKRAGTNILESLFDDFLTTRAGMINIGQEIQGPDGRISEDER